MPDGELDPLRSLPQDAFASRPCNYGITIPLPDTPMKDQRALLGLAGELGYTELWTAEVAGSDAFTPLAVAATWTDMRVGSAVVSAYTRGPALLASSAAALADLAPGRFVLGIGSSSATVVRDWNGISFDAPLDRVRDTVRFLRSALKGDKVTAKYKTFNVEGFRLDHPPEVIPPVFVAALRPRMLQLAVNEADGLILNWLAASDVPTVLATARSGLDRPWLGEVVSRLFVCPSEDVDAVRAAARRLIASYLTVPAYAAYHQWLGRGEALAEMWRAWSEGDRKRAVAAIPDDLVDDLVIHGSPEACRTQIERYFDAGVTSAALQLLPFNLDLRQALCDLAPRTSTRTMIPRPSR